MADQNSINKADYLSGTANQLNVTADGAPQTVSLSSTLVMPGTCTLNADPVTALQAATKQYVDAIAALGLEFKASVVCASTTALTVTYANGTAGVGATLTNAGAMAAIQLDGISPTVGQRVLIKNQAAPAQNGVYTVTTVGSGAVNWVLTRATDYDTAAEMQPGSFVAVDQGTTQAVTSFLQTSTVVTVGTDAVSFTQFTYGTTFPSLIVTGNLRNDALTASRVTVTDGSKNLASSSMAAADLPYSVLQNGAAVYALDTGAADAYVVTLSPVPAAYVTGMAIMMKAANANTTTSTINVNGLGPITIKKGVSTNLAANDILAGQMCSLVYDGTNFQLNPPPSTGTGSVTSVATGGLATGGPITTTGTVTVTAATQANQETATSTTVAVVPGVQQYHPSACKVWVRYDDSATTIRASYNVSSVTENAGGDYTINFDVDFSSEYYGIAAMGAQWAAENNLLVPMLKTGVAPTASSFRMVYALGSPLGNINATDYVNVVFFGDQA